MFLNQVINVCMMKGQIHPFLLSRYHNLLPNYKIKTTIPLETIGDSFVVSLLGGFELFQKRWVIYIILVSDYEQKRHSFWGKIAESVKDTVTSIPNALVKSPVNRVYWIDVLFQKGCPYGRRIR